MGWEVTLAGGELSLTVKHVSRCYGCLCITDTEVSIRKLLHMSLPKSFIPPVVFEKQQNVINH